MEKELNRLIDYLSGRDFLIDYKWIKSEEAFLLKNSFGFNMVELQNWESVNNNNELSVLIRPLFFVRFNLLHKWFVPFSFKSQKDQRYNYSIAFDSEDFGMNEKYYLSKENDDFDITSVKIEASLKKGVEYFSKFRTIEDVYSHKVLPLFEDNCILASHGAEWIFESLLLTHLVEPSKFDILEDKLKAHAKKRNDEGEPNIIEYYPKWKEIIKALKRVENA